MVAYLQKSKRSKGFHQIIDFLNDSHIQYALTKNPTIYVSFIKQFWRTATASTDANGQVELTASIDGHTKTITEAYLRRHLPNSEIFEQLALMRYETDFDKLTFQKDMQKKHLQPHTRINAAHSLTNKVFSNMKRISRGYSGVEVPLFPTMLNAPTTSPSRITSSPSLSPEPFHHLINTSTSAPSTSQPQHSQSSPDAEETIPTPHESPLHSVHSLGRDEGSQSLHELTVLCTTLSKKVEGLESDLKHTKELTMLLLQKDEEALEDSFKQGRKISDIDEDPNISLVQDEEMTWFQDADTEVQKDTDMHLRTSDDTELCGVSTASRQVSTTDISIAGEIGSTAGVKAKDKGKGIMTEPEPKKKTKLKERQKRAGLEAAIRLQEQQDEEERQRLARDAEIAQRLHEEINVVVAQETSVQAKQSEEREQVIDWSDPSVIRIQDEDFQRMEYVILGLYLKEYGINQINSFVPMNSELEVQRLKRKGQDFEAKPAKRQRTEEVSESVQEQTDEEPKTEELSQEKLHQLMIIVPKEGKIIRVGDHIEVYQTFSDMLKNFDREDLLKLWSLVQDRFNSSGLTDDKEKELWVELKMLFEPDEETLLELQRYMHDPLKWWLYDMCVVYHVSTERGQDIFMLVEMDYPLINGLATLMICNKLRVDQHSEIADDLLTKIYNIANRTRQ
ncbi:hypothetical protein Tco_1342630 [Tanacetum coccineum]